MTPRERELAAIQHKLADRIPVDAISIENQDRIAGLLGIEQAKVYERLGIDGRIVSAPYRGEVRQPVEGLPVTEWGTVNTGDYGTGRPYPLGEAVTLAEIERYPIPDPSRYDHEAAANTARRLSEYAARGPYWKPLFCRVCDLMGMESALIQMVEEPLLFEALLERVYLYTLDYCERLLCACGDAMPILCLGDDFATQRGLLFSPEQWRRFLKPRYARLFEMGKTADKFIWFHSCGDITAVLPDLIDIGVDVWETVQLHTLPISPKKLKRDYGKHITFFGGVNTQRLPFKKPEEVRAEVVRCIKLLGEGGGYICGPDHHIKPDVSAENALALFDTAQAFRREGYIK